MSHGAFDRAQAFPAERADYLTVPAVTQEELDGFQISFRDHAQYVLNHSRLTVQMYRSAYGNFRHFLHDPAHVGRPLDDLLRDLDTWVAWNRKRGLSAITTNTYFRMLRPFFHYLEKKHGFPNPYHGAKAPPIPRHRLPKALKPEQLERILAAARNYPWRTELQRARGLAMIAIMIYGGLRKGEVLRLQYADVNLEEGTIRIVAGKGRFGGKDRTVYMPAELRALLTQYVAMRRQHGFTCPEFFATRGNRPLSEIQFRRIIECVREASGVPFFAHALRHSYITMLLRSGVPIHVVQTLAGHADITTTALYTAVWDDDKRAAVQRFRLNKFGHRRTKA
jgi:site-specific recombinase XerD